MDKSRLSELIQFFSKIEIEEQDVTTEEEKNAGLLAVIVQYKFEGKIFSTNRLYYKNIDKQADVKDVQQIDNYFGPPVFWLDIEKHQWPKGSGFAELEKTVIPEIANIDDQEFQTFLRLIANNSKTGYLQQLTAAGRRNTYGFNLENNNHWHDLILLVKEIINKKDGNIDKKYFSRLVFEWDKGRGRTSLSPYFGNRSIINHLIENINSMQEVNLKSLAINLLKYKHQIILQGPPGTGKTRLAKLIADEICGATGEQKIIQFHPAYSYEDFVRGISARSTENQIAYVTENRILADFAQKAQKNLLDSKKGPIELTKELWNRNLFEKFKDNISDEIDEKGLYPLNNTVSLIAVEDNAFRYTGQVWKNEFRMKFDDILQLFQKEAIQRQDIKRQDYSSGLARTHASYFKIILDKFREFVQSNPEPEVHQTTEAKRNFVIIIDEINRANLPAVLGELIYALEYRDEPVESIYDLEGIREIVLPSNLFIIGTMNTADRSVGHIDYAIRRRFAFVDVPPTSAVLDETIKDTALCEKAKALFSAVEELFSEQFMTSDFDANDVQLGHSYFLAESEATLRFKLEYEIKPILHEYLKDGIFKSDVKEKIESLHV